MEKLKSKIRILFSVSDPKSIQYLNAHGRIPRGGVRRRDRAQKEAP